MKKNFALLTVAALLQTTPSLAMPMLSADGSLLTGVDVGGTLYDVNFGDGVAGEVFAGITFNAAREVEANAVSAAIVVALNLIGAPFEDIAGCDVFIDYNCRLFNPDSFVANGSNLYRDVEWAIAFDDGPWFNVEADTRSFESTYDSTPDPEWTWVLYARAPNSPVPVPATVLLFALGLVGLGINSRKRRAKCVSRSILPLHHAATD